MKVGDRGWREKSDSGKPPKSETTVRIFRPSFSTSRKFGGWKKMMSYDLQRRLEISFYNTRAVRSSSYTAFLVHPSPALSLSILRVTRTLFPIIQHLRRIWNSTPPKQRIRCKKVYFAVDDSTTGEKIVPKYIPVFYGAACTIFGAPPLACLSIWYS